MSKYYLKLSLYFIMSLLVILTIGFVLFIKNIPHQSSINSLSPTQAIVILTGGTNRIYYGLKLALDDKFKDSKILISGAGNDFSIYHHKEFKKLKHEYPNLVQEILPRLSIGKIAATTEMNALETEIWKELHHIKNMTLVTSNYHLPRSLIEFKHIVKSTSIQPFAVKSPILALDKWWDFPGTFKIIFAEYCKYQAVLVFYLINDFLEFIWGI